MVNIVLSKKEELLRDCYKINGEEYLRLEFREPKDLFNYQIWSIIVKKIFIHKKLDNLFEIDPFIYRLISSSSYSNLINDKNEYGWIGDLNSSYFDHTASIKFCDDESHVSCSDTIRGIISFPYFHEWEYVDKWMEAVPDTFSIYIINPVLIFYGIGTVGLFLTPKYYDGYYIELFNRFIISLTGYPLFLTFTMDDSVEEINYIDLELTKENFVNELYVSSNKNKGLLKLLNFWKDNVEVSIPLIDDNYCKYLDLQPYCCFSKITFINFSSTKAFDLVHEDTGEILGTFHKFILDDKFKVIGTEKGEFHLTDNQLKDLLDGKYDFKLRAKACHMEEPI